MTAAEVLRSTLDYFGPNGENWGGSKRGGGTCINLAVCTVAGSTSDAWAPALFCVLEELGALPPCMEPIWDFNDDPHTTWLDAQLVLKRALHRAEEAGI